MANVYIKMRSALPRTEPTSVMPTLTLTTFIVGSIVSASTLIPSVLIRAFCLIKSENRLYQPQVPAVP